MLSSFQHGQRRPANGLSALLQSASPAQATPPGRLSSHTGKPPIAAHTGRPGPQPHTAAMATAVSRWNAETKRVMERFINDTRNATGQQRLQRQTAREEAEWSDRATQRQWEEKKFPSYDPRRGHAYDTELVDQAHFSTGYHGHQFGEVWVYVRAHGPYNVLEYAVVNPHTGHLLTFTPEAALDAPGRVYLPEDAQVRGVAAGTGVAGVYLERGFYGVAGGALALPYAAALAVAASETAAGGVVITAFETTGTQLVKQLSWRTFGMKVGADFGVQFGGGVIKHGGNARDAMGEVSAISLLAAWLLPAAGWAGSLRNAVLKSTVKVTVDVKQITHPRLSLKLPSHLDTMEGFGNYLTAVTVDVLGDRFKSVLIKWAAPAWARSMGSLRQSGSAVGQWVAAHRITLGTLGQTAASLAIRVQKDQDKARVAEVLKAKPVSRAPRP